MNEAANAFLSASVLPKYCYNFSFLGRPIIQYPQDMVAIQELIWQVKPDLIIETGVAHGGSLIMSAGMLALLDLCENPNQPFSISSSKRKVIGIDIDIRAHNRAAIETHAFAPMIDLVQGSSIDARIVDQVRGKIGDAKNVMVFLDSNHTHEHVLAELEAYADLVSVGSYCVVFDTLIEQMPEDSYPDRPWGVGDNPKTAVWQWLKQNDKFEIDTSIPNKILITVAQDGFLKKVKD